MPSAESFPPDVVPKLKTYVYRLIDPRNGETFYIGKGHGNRVFAHIHDELSQDGDDLSDKLKRIREIRVAGFEVAHVIHRHGMDEATAFEVEAALMDAYPGLSNIAGGTGSSDYGAMHAREIIRRYSAPPADFRHKAILISVNRSAAETSLYEATRYAWKISRRKAMQAEVILATLRGLIVDAFVADDWLPATAANFPGHEDAPGRLCIRRTGGPSRAASGVRREARPGRVPKARRVQPDQVHMDQVGFGLSMVQHIAERVDHDD